MLHLRLPRANSVLFERYIVGADAVHYLFLGASELDLSPGLMQFVTMYIDQYKKEYPTAKLIAPSEAISNVSKAGKDISFDGGAAP